MSLSRWIMLTATGIALAGCQYLPFTGEKTGPEYKDAKVLAPLDLPPDLVSEASQPGLTLPSPASAAEASASRSVAPAAVTGGQMPVPAAQATTPVPAAPVAELQTQGEEAVLRLDMSPEQVWPVVSRTLQQEGYKVARQDNASGQLQTDWKSERRGLSGLLGSAVAANARSRYTITLKPGENGVLLSASQEVQENDSGEIGDVWTATTPDDKAGLALLKAVQKNLQQPSMAQAAGQPSVERLTDARGPYLILSLPPAQAQQRVSGVLKDMGYELRAGDTAGIFLLSRTDAAAQEGFFQSIFTQFRDGILGAFKNEEPNGDTHLQLRLSPDAKSPGTVLEILPEDGAAKEDKAVRTLVDRLAERLRAAS